MKSIFPVLLLFCFTACTDNPPTDNSPIVSSISTPSNKTDKAAKVESLGILYLQEQTLESWTKIQDSIFSLSNSTKVNTVQSLPIGRYTLHKKTDHWLLNPIDSGYPFTSTTPVMVHPEQKTGFYFNPENHPITILSQIHQLYIVPSRLNKSAHFSPPFGAGPQRIAQYQQLEKELRSLTKKQIVHE